MNMGGVWGTGHSLEENMHMILLNLCNPYLYFGQGNERDTKSIGIIVSQLNVDLNHKIFLKHVTTGTAGSKFKLSHTSKPLIREYRYFSNNSTGQLKTF